MLSWLRSLYAGWKRRNQTSSGSECTRRSEDDPAGADDEDRTGERADDQPAAREDAPTSWIDLLGQPEISKQDVRIELGLQPDEFLTQLVHSADGRMWQADLVETTGWSKSTVSRYLDGLETDGTVERVWIGRQKLVSLPEAAPETPDATDEPSVGSTTGSWASESDRLT